MDVVSLFSTALVEKHDISFPPANCGKPIVPINGFISPYQNTTEGSVIVFGCNSGFVPAGDMTAVCASDGRWSPDPATIVCTCKSTYNIEKELLMLISNVSNIKIALLICY